MFFTGWHLDANRYRVYACLYALVRCTAMIGAPAVSYGALSASGEFVASVQSPSVAEASGVIASRRNRGIVWMHNDGRTGYVYGVGPGGDVAATIALQQPVADFEDIAIGPGPQSGVDYLYVADIGDNNLLRQCVQTYRFREPKIETIESDAPTTIVRDAERFELCYPGAKLDAEALLVDPQSGDLLVVAKERRRARVYVASSSQLVDGARIDLRLAVNLKIGEVTGGDVAPDRSAVVLRSDDKGWIWRCQASQKIEEAFSSQMPREIPVRHPSQKGDGEAIGFHPTSDAYFTISEGRKPSLCLFPVPSPAE
ncbi:MAG: hypothetical protein AAF961_06230 [Planctomycetota bacterium]